MRTCNLCGRIFTGEGLTVSRHLGEESEHNGKELELALCPACLDAVINQCRVAPFTQKAEKRMIQKEVIIDAELKCAIRQIVCEVLAEILKDDEDGGELVIETKDDFYN